MSNENISLSVLIVRLDSQCYTSCSTIHTQSAPVSDVLLIPPKNDLSPNHLDLNQPSSSSSRTLMSQKTRQLAPRILQILSKNVRICSLSHFYKKCAMLHFVDFEIFYPGILSALSVHSSSPSVRYEAKTATMSKSHNFPPFFPGPGRKIHLQRLLQDVLDEVAYGLPVEEVL